MTIFLTQENGARITDETGFGSLLDETSPVRAEATVAATEPATSTRRVTHPHTATVEAT